jgi:hypothetical protein
MSYFDGVIRMLKSILEVSRATRIEQIISLFDQICIEYPIRVEIKKINEPTQLIIFAWILAICRLSPYTAVKFCNRN